MISIIFEDNFIQKYIANLGLIDPLLGFNSVLEWLAELRETLYLRLPVSYKKCNPGTARGERCTGQSVRVWSGV